MRPGAKIALPHLQEGVTTRQKQEALYGSTAVHATFGDVELAQITLRGWWRQLQFVNTHEHCDNRKTALQPAVAGSYVVTGCSVGAGGRRVLIHTNLLELRALAT